MSRIGVISDTHNFLDPRVLTLFEGVEQIIHAGDIGLPRIIADLERVAPVVAVIGNTDDPVFGWRETEVITTAGQRLLIHHIVDPARPHPQVQRLIAEARPQIVVFGHTHRPYQEWHDGVLFLNPGSAGSGRFGLPRSVAVLELDPGRLDVAFHTLGD